MSIINEWGGNWPVRLQVPSNSNDVGSQQDWGDSQPDRYPSPSDQQWGQSHTSQNTSSPAASNNIRPPVERPGDSHLKGLAKIFFKNAACTAATICFSRLIAKTIENRITQKVSDIISVPSSGPRPSLPSIVNGGTEIAPTSTGGFGQKVFQSSTSLARRMININQSLGFDVPLKTVLGKWAAVQPAFLGAPISWFSSHLIGTNHNAVNWGQWIGSNLGSFSSNLQGHVSAVVIGSVVAGSLAVRDNFFKP